MTTIKTDTSDSITAHSFMFAKATFTGIDLANDAVKLQKRHDTLEGDKDVFGCKFISFAKTCKSSDEFLTLCGSVEARKSWKSKQNPEGSKTAPAVWKQYKSNVKTAWESFGISPQGYTNVSELSKALNKARKDKAEKETESTGEATGTAIAKAINTDGKLGAAIGSVTECFDGLNPELQAEMLSELHTLVTYFEEQRAGAEDQTDVETEVQDEVDALAEHLAADAEDDNEAIETVMQTHG